MNLIRRRLSAFFLDMLLVIFISVSLSNLSYLNPYKSQYERTVEEYNQVYDEFSKSLLDSSSSSYIEPTEANKYMIDNIIPIRMKVDKYNVFYSLWYLIIYFLYFVIFVYFNNGQSLGKKLFKIKVVDKSNNKPSILKLIIRSIFNGSSLYLGLNIMILIRIILPYITSTGGYYYSYTLLSFLALIFEVSLIIIFFVKKGGISTNDLIARTKVIEENKTRL